MIPDPFTRLLSRLPRGPNLSCHPKHRAQGGQSPNHDAKIRIKPPAMRLPQQQIRVFSCLHGVNPLSLAFLIWSALVLSRRGFLGPLLPLPSIFPATGLPLRPEQQATSPESCTSPITRSPIHSCESSQDVCAVNSRGRLAKALQENSITYKNVHERIVLPRRLCEL